MTDLFEKSIQTLELPKVLERLAEQAVTEEGKERCLALRPLTDADDVQRALDETTAAVNMLIQRGSPGFSGVKPVGASLHRADMGGSLNTRELLEIAAVLRCARTAKEYGDTEEKTPISHLFRALTPNRFLEDTITNSIVGEDELADSASSELASIRRHMRSTEAKVREILQKIISSNQSKYLQESIITIRSDRYVVPVKSEFKNSIPGLVHDLSGSGSTFFIEPMGVVKANNELRELAAREKKEIERILAELSAQCAAHKEDISEDYDLLIWLDTIFARGRLSLNMEASQPRLSEKYLRLQKARHPLLDKKTAVANDLELGDKFDTLMITGPNTGGKTVTLKTIGLLTLMAQCGLHIPAGADSAVRVFDRVLNDWGFDLVKLDFLYGAAPFGNAHESRAARMRRAMELLRSWCGQKAILGCGVPVMPAFGLVDYCRVSCDVSLDWDDVWYMRLFHRERVSTKQALNNTVFRRQLNGRAYGSDPDVFFLRKENCKLTAEQKRTLATVNALLGNVFLTSDMPSRYTDAQRDEYRRLRRLFEHAKQVEVETENGVITIRYSLDEKRQELRCSAIYRE